MSGTRYSIVDTAQVKAVACPCGSSRRAFLDDPARTASLHRLSVRGEAREHYHHGLTEMYYVLQGEGHIDLDGDRHPLRPGVAVLIHPGCRHRAIGELELLVIPVPAFDPEDEHFDP